MKEGKQPRKEKYRRSLGPNNCPQIRSLVLSKIEEQYFSLKNKNRLCRCVEFSIYIMFRSLFVVFFVKREGRKGLVIVKVENFTKIVFT